MFKPLIIGFNIYSEVKVKEIGNTEGSMFGEEEIKSSNEFNGKEDAHSKSKQRTTFSHSRRWEGQP